MIAAITADDGLSAMTDLTKNSLGGITSTPDSTTQTDKGNKAVLSDKRLILVIDDDEIVRVLLSKMLEREGYSVIACADGLEGISIFRQYKDEIDMVLLDMIMPGMNGAETFMELKKLSNSIKALILSGYTKDDAVQQIMDNGGCGFIQKPVTHTRLFSEIERIISSKEQ